MSIPHDLISGLVLSGGQGRRMGGTDKGLQPFKGAPMVMHTILRLEPQVGIVKVNANRNLAAYESLGVVVIPDVIGAFAELDSCKVTARAVCHPEKLHIPITSIQIEYSLLNRDAEVEIFPCSDDTDIGILAWAPLGRGVLTGKYRNGIPSDSRAAAPHFVKHVEPYLDSHSSKIVEAVSVAAEGLGFAPLEVALAWVRDTPGVTSAIVGARTGAQLRGILRSEEISLPGVVRQALDEVSC